MVFYAQGRSLTQRCYLNNVPKLDLYVMPRADFGDSLVRAIKAVLEQRPLVRLHRHVPRIQYLDTAQFQAGLVGWKSEEERMSFLIPGWYIGKRHVFNLHRKICTLPKLEANQHAAELHAAAIRDVIASWPEVEDRRWLEARKRADLCRLIAVLREYEPGMTHLRTGTVEISIDFLEERWGQINQLWRLGSGE